MDTGTPANNVIPAKCTGAVNIRFNDTHTGQSLSDWLQTEANKITAETGVEIDMTIKISGESFITPPARCPIWWPKR